MYNPLTLKKYNNPFPYHGHQASSYANQWAHCDDHQSQLPPADESNHEAEHKCRNPLNENRHLISNAGVDLIDVTEMDTRDTQC